MTNPSPTPESTVTPKPCPFCGAVPPNNQPSGYIFCPNGYDYGTDKPRVDCCPLTYGMPLEKWNHRVSPSALSTEQQQRLAEIRERLEKATPGPWFVDPITRGRILGPVVGSGRKARHVSVVELGNDAACGDPDCCQDSPHVSIEAADAALIANAPADLRWLLDLVARPTSGDSTNA